MNKRFLLVASLLAALGGVTVLLLQWYGHSRDGAVLTQKEVIEASRRFHGAQPAAQAAPASLPTSRSIRLAVGSLGLADDSQNRQLADLVTAELSGAPGLELVERQSLDKVLAELQMSLSGLVRAKDAVVVGKLLRADWFMLGTRTVVAGTNSIVVRVVDARTGILRDAGVFVRGQTPTGLASDVAEFTRQCRKNASLGKKPVYLAVGTFQDLGINSRQADFPTQLRGYLIAAFQGGPVTLLEREYVEALLQEVHMDLAGLTEGSSLEAPAPMQSAFWTVTGSYQSYETTNLQIELDLEVARSFGKTESVSLRGQPGGPLYQEVKRAIDQAMSTDTAAIIPTRQSEVRLQMANGKQLAGINNPFHGPDLVYLGEAFTTELDEQKAARKKRNAEEALSAFQTVLLLEPTNREAKLFVAACLRNNTIERVEEARHYYREVIEDAVQDKWSEIARKALSASFGWGDADAKVLWFGSAAASTTDSKAAQFYHQEAEAAKTEVRVKGTGHEAQAQAEARLWGSITNALLGSVAGPMGIEEFTKTFGTNQAAAAQRLADLYPKLKSQDSLLRPHLLAAVVTAQVDTNAPVVVEFRQVLEDLIRQPTRLFKPHEFWSHIPPAICDWSWRHEDYRLVATLLEGKTAASAIYTVDASYSNGVWAIETSDEDRMRLAFAYLGTREWDKALRNFQTFSNQPFSMPEDGPWGPARTVLLTGREADYCRQKLGLPIARRGTEFQLGKPVFALCRDQVFTANEQGLWLGLERRLLHLGFDLKTNLVVDLPADNHAPITAFCLSPTNIWIGTDGGGLYDYEKGSRQFRHLGERDGLLMDKIASLYLTTDALWIGYGRRGRLAEPRSDGGLGKIDLHTRQITSFMPSVLEGPGVSAGQGVEALAGRPTRNSVLAIMEGASGDVWFLAEVQTPLLCRYRTVEKTWDIAVNQACSCLLRDQKNLFVGRYWNYQGENRTEKSLGVSILDLTAKPAAWRELKRTDELPPGRVTALALDNGRLWVGGSGYIALVDPDKAETRAVAYVQAESVDCLQAAGGFLWAQVNCQVYCVNLANLSSSQRTRRTVDWQHQRQKSAGYSSPPLPLPPDLAHVPPPADPEEVHRLRGQ